MASWGFPITSAQHGRTMSCLWWSGISVVILLRGNQLLWCKVVGKQVWGFLGFVNFYWWFIWNFSEKAKLLKDLLKKDHQFWMDEWLARSIWQLKETVHWGTSPYNARPYKILPNQNRCIWICNRSSSKQTLMATDTQSPLFQNHFHQLREITKSMTKNY